MFPVLFKLGPITIYTYGVFVFLGVIASYLVCRNQADKEGISRKIFSHIFFWALIWGFFGARVVYILVEWEWLLSNPLSVILSRSGFVFYGGIISGILTVLVLTKKYKINILKSGDIAAIGIPLGHALGRVGCFSYGCCYGKPTDHSFGVLFPPDSPAGILGVKVIPTQLISAFFLVLIFLTLVFITRRKRFDGQIFASYFVIYGVFRFIIEFFRGDPRGMFLFLSTSQIISVFMVIVGFVLFLRLKPNK